MASGDTWAGWSDEQAHCFRVPPGDFRGLSLCRALWCSAPESTSSNRCPECSAVLEAEGALSQIPSLLPKPTTTQRTQTMPTITVGSGAPAIEPGTYPVTLVGIEPKTIIPKTGDNAGQEVEIFEWSFAIDEGELENEIIKVSSSKNCGPKSKMFSFLTALLGGRPPEAGASFETEQLLGRQALAQITANDAGWPQITALLSLPTRRATQTPAPQAAPRQAYQQPAPVAAGALRGQVAATKLPF